MKSKNIILANAPINNGNRGCVALSITAMYLLDKLLSKQNIAYKLYLPDSGFNEQALRTYKILDKEIQYYSCNYAQSLNKKGWLKMLAKPKELKENTQIFNEADFIFDIGQGDSFADIYGENRFKLIDRIHKVANKKKKPYCLLPQTIGPFDNEAIKQKAIKSIAKSNMVMARDKMSLDYVLQNVPQQKSVSEYIDVAFFMPYEKENFDSNYTHVGLNISGLLWNGGYTRNNQFGLKNDYPQTIRSIINYFLSKPNVKLHLVSHVVGSERNVENDYEVAFDLYQSYKHPNLILSPLFLSPIDAKSYIAGMDYFMGARMHATIAAFSSGVAVTPMAYSRKFNGLFVDTLSYPHMTDLKANSEKEILTQIERDYNNRVELKAIIDERMSGIVAEREKELEKDLSIFLGIQ